MLNYDLHSGHRVRYFGITEKPHKVAKSLGKWLKANKHLEICSISFDGTFSEAAERDEWTAYVVYLGVPVEEED